MEVSSPPPVPRRSRWSPMDQPPDLVLPDPKIDSPAAIEQPPDPKIEEALCKSEKLLRKYQEDVWNGGYDVDWAPSTMGGPIKCGGSLRPVSHEYMDEMLETTPDSYHACVQGPIEFAIDEINAETGSKYKLVDVVKVVANSNLGGLYTFTAVDDDDDCAVIQTLQAMVSFGIPNELHEWKFKGDKTPRGPKPKPIHSLT